MKILNKRSVVLIAIGMVCAVVLLMLADKEPTKEKAEPDCELLLEERLRGLISELEGVSDVTVMVTLECGTEYVYAVNSEESESAVRSEYYSAGESEALLIKEIAPRMKGVAVVCKGGDDMAVKTKIIQLVSSVLDLPSNRIFVGT